MEAQNQNQEDLYFFDYKGHGGPSFHSEADTLEYINTDLLKDIDSRDPKDHSVGMRLNGAALIKISTDEAGEKNLCPMDRIKYCFIS